MLLLDDYCYQSPSSIANQKLTIFLQLRFQKTVRLYSEQIMSVEKYPSLKIKIPLNKSVNDRTTCPTIQGFVLAICNFNQTLSVDRPLFAASIRTDDENPSNIFTHVQLV